MIFLELIVIIRTHVFLQRPSKNVITNQFNVHESLNNDRYTVHFMIYFRFRVKR